MNKKYNYIFFLIIYIKVYKLRNLKKILFIYIYLIEGY